MKRQPVQSSSISSVGYDAAARELHVEFASSGHVYVYPDVDPEAHEALLGAASIGVHFGKHIRPNFEGKKQ